MEEQEQLRRVLYHAEHAECLTYFTIEGKFDPDQITTYLRTAPEQVRRIGDSRPNGEPAKTALWRFGSVSGTGTDIDMQMKETIRALIPKEGLLRQIKLQYNASLVLTVVPIVRYDEPAPALAPSLAVMRFCLETGTELVINLYVSCPDDLAAGG